MRIFATIVTVLMVLSITTLTALAGDFAKREIHGFSVDGGLFAFEEYGVQDGSGFPYSNLYIIDTATDQWTANSPYRVLLEDETKTVFDAREEAKILAGPVMKSFEGRGLTVGTNKPTEVVAEPHRMVVYPRTAVPPIDEAMEFRISEISMEASPLCEAFGPSVGFNLTQIATKPDAAVRILHEDMNVPDSRKCPRGYSIADIVTFYPEAAPPVMAILILVRSQGFEGPDGRFLAITGSLKGN